MIADDVVRGALDILLSGEHCMWKPCAVFLYGSYARNDADEASDIDLLAITESRQKDIVFSFDGYLVEVSCATISQILHRAALVTPENNNYYVNLFADARLLHSNDVPAALALQAQVQALGKNHAVVPSTKSLASVQESLFRLTRSAKRHSARASLSARHAWLARMRADTLMSRAIHLRFWVDGLPTNSLPQLLREVERLYPSLHDFITKYLSASVCSEQVAIAVALAESLFAAPQTIAAGSRQAELLD